jgi:hypothetical protein
MVPQFIIDEAVERIQDQRGIPIQYFELHSVRNPTGISL